MKCLLTFCLVLVGTGLHAQTTTVRSQGSNVGNGRAYVAPVTTRTYTIPAVPNRTYIPPPNTYNNSSKPAATRGYNNRTSPSSPVSGSGGGTSRKEEKVPDFGIKSKTRADESIQTGIKNHDWDAVFALFDLPEHEFEARAGGGRNRAAFLMSEELGKMAIHANSVLPVLYKMVYARKLYYEYPVFMSVFPGIFLTDLSATEFAVNNSCLFVGDYQHALTNLRSHTLYGAKKPWIKKKNESYAGEYDKQEIARNYINYMAGRCFQQLGMMDSAKKYLALGSGFEGTWEKLYTEGTAIRAADKQ